MRGIDRPETGFFLGESFLALANHRFGPRGLYILDEPEAALSIIRQSRPAAAHANTRRGARILLGFPGANIYVLDPVGFQRAPYEETPQFQLTRSFLDDRERFFHHLFTEK